MWLESTERQEATTVLSILEFHTAGSRALYKLHKTYNLCCGLVAAFWKFLHLPHSCPVMRWERVSQLLRSDEPRNFCPSRTRKDFQPRQPWQFTKEEPDLTQHEKGSWLRPGIRVTGFDSSPCAATVKASAKPKRLRWHISCFPQGTAAAHSSSPKPRGTRCAVDTHQGLGTWLGLPAPELSWVESFWPSSGGSLLA